MTVVFCIAIVLAVSTLNNISLLFGKLEFNLALLKVLNIEDVFVVRGEFEFHEEHREVGAWLIGA
jgi:L-asparagine transporter-like permease